MSGEHRCDRYNGEIELLTLLDEAFDKRSWHGPNLRGALRGVSETQAAWRPSKRRHNIWELALHAAYWKYVVRRRLVGAKRGSFPLKGSNFFERPSAGADWNADLELLNEQHRLLRETVASFKKTDAKKLWMIRGAAAHDLYHAGQIQLLKRLCPIE